MFGLWILLTWTRVVRRLLGQKPNSNKTPRTGLVPLSHRSKNLMSKWSQVSAWRLLRSTITLTSWHEYSGSQCFDSVRTIQECQRKIKNKLPPTQRIKKTPLNPRLTSPLNRIWNQDCARVKEIEEIRVTYQIHIPKRWLKWYSSIAMHCCGCSIPGRCFVVDEDERCSAFVLCRFVVDGEEWSLVCVYCWWRLRMLYHWGMKRFRFDKEESPFRFRKFTLLPIFAAISLCALLLLFLFSFSL